MMTKRALLVVLLIWALMMIVPDLMRVVRPLAAFGFYANNNGLIYDVTGPFDEEKDSPAWRAGIRPGDQLDLARMRCFPYEAHICASTIASVGGNLYVTLGRTATLYLAATEDRPARQVFLTAAQRPANFFVRGVLFLDQIAGIAVVLAAAWLVWTRPGPMSWGFFLYVIWFNPGQGFEFYALLQRWPRLLLLQDVLGCLSQAAGYTGLLVFVMRAPTGVLQPEWARVERALRPVTVIVAAALMGSYASAFGFGTETLTRATILFGLIVSFCAVLYLDPASKVFDAERQPTPPLGDVGQLDRLACIRNRRSQRIYDCLFFLLGHRAAGRHRGSSVSREWHPFAVRFRSAAQAARRERRDPSSSRHDPGADDERPRGSSPS